MHRNCSRLWLASALCLALVAYVGFYISEHNSKAGFPAAFELERKEADSISGIWQQGPEALQPELINSFQAAAYDVLDQIGIPRNLSDSDLGEACEPLMWPCVATTGKCVLERIAQVIDGHLAPAPSACVCFLTGMAPADVAVPGREMALSCPFVCMQALLSAFNNHLRQRNGPGGQTLDCLKASAVRPPLPHAGLDSGATRPSRPATAVPGPARPRRRPPLTPAGRRR